MESNLNITPKEFWENGGTFELINPMLQAGLLTLSKAMDIIIYRTYGKTIDEKYKEFLEDHKIKEIKLTNPLKQAKITYVDENGRPIGHKYFK